jgi:hypothetical protein
MRLDALKDQIQNQGLNNNNSFGQECPEKKVSITHHAAGVLSTINFIRGILDDMEKGVMDSDQVQGVENEVDEEDKQLHTEDSEDGTGTVGEVESSD